MAIPTQTDIKRLEYRHLGRCFCCTKSSNQALFAMEYKHLGRPYVSNDTTVISTMIKAISGVPYALINKVSGVLMGNVNKISKLG